MRKLLYLGVVLTIFTTSCYYDNAEELYQNYPKDCDLTDVKYSTDVSAIIASQCLSCHTNPGAENDIDLTTYNNVVTHAALVKGRVSLPSADPDVMPPGGMSNCNVDQIVTWIDNGAPNN